MCPYEWKNLDSDNKLETKKQIPGKQKNHFVVQIATFLNSLWKSIDWKMGYNRLQIISFVYMDMVNSLKMQTFQRCVSSLCHTYNYTRRWDFFISSQGRPRFIVLFFKHCVSKTESNPTTKGTLCKKVITFQLFISFNFWGF